MGIDVQDCTTVPRRWDKEAGLIETPLAFASLDELHAMCLANIDSALIDRIIIRGRNTQGLPQVVTFDFQSITVAPNSKT